MTSNEKGHTTLYLRFQCRVCGRGLTRFERQENICKECKRWDIRIALSMWSLVTTGAIVSLLLGR